MRKTGRSRRDGVVAATVALVVNGGIAWSLQSLLSPGDIAVEDAASLQVVFIAAVPRQASVIAPARQPTSKARTSPAIERPLQAYSRPGPVSPELPAQIAPVRPMSAVYLQQARQWAQQKPVAVTARADPFADRRIRLPNQADTRFTLAHQVTVADAVAMIGQAFGNGPHPCIRNRQDVAAYATGGDELALEMALDVERHCRP